ncbi:MAG TPA: CHAT domain-containing protein [Candidatus Sulfotelmatobacter sp.]|nr:CHAT domain-containing protein [Candidatus Sulfotelmatobacter sp.]
MPSTLGAFLACSIALMPEFCPAQQAGSEPASPSDQPVHHQAPRWAGSPYAEEISAAWVLLDSAKSAAAEDAFRSIIQKASNAGDTYSEAEGHVGLSAVRFRQAKYAEARVEAESAMAQFDSLHNALGLAEAHLDLGEEAAALTDQATARKWLNQALKEFEAAGAETGMARTLLVLARVVDSYGERVKLSSKALELAQKTGDTRRQGQALHEIGQWLFHEGDADAAEQNYKQAEALLQGPGNRIYRVGVLLSEGRLQRAHGHLEDALATYDSALKLADEVGDKDLRIELLNAMGACYGDQEKYRDALAVFEKAFELSKQIGLPRNTETLRQNIAETYADLGQEKEAIAILEEVNRQTPDPFPYGAQFRYATLALAYTKLNDYEPAKQAAAKSVEEARARKNAQFVSQPLMLKAEAEEKLGQDDEALADVREALKVIEELRAHLVPSDFMKRGFGERNQTAFNLSVRLLEKVHQPAQALETAEQARSRAFLDLLASHEVVVQASEKPVRSAEKIETAKAAGEGVGPATGQGDGSATTPLTARAGKPSGSDRSSAAEPQLASVVSTESISFAQMQEQASRLHSTILSYWVAKESTFVWVLDPTNGVHSAQINVQRDRLTELVRSVWPIGGAEQSSNSPAVVASASRNGASQRDDAKFPARGEKDLEVNAGQKNQWRELYKLLIAPIESFLPTQQESRLTIVPNGPLFSLSFGGLQDARGRYLLQRYVLDYVPSMSVLWYTSTHAAQTATRTPHYLFVADPAGMTKLGLPPLPGSRKEVADVVRTLPSTQVTVLAGEQAQEQAIKTGVARSSVIHLATHGIVDDSRPFASFLALADGKLTAGDIYGLRLNADLVFLSACRSGMGKVTGDGVLGLTRAFMYAGTRSIVATLWDVADEPTTQLVSNFYKNIGRGQDKAQALRAAQLSVLRQLRAGKVKVATRRGPLTLPDNPVFWASFILIGEP